MSLIKEFKQFALKGNALDLAIGMIIGTEFGKIVSSLVTDIMMPPIGKLVGGVDFTNLFISLNGVAYETLALAKEAGAPTINYGLFISHSIKFIIIAFCVFLFVKLINRLKKEKESLNL